MNRFVEPVVLHQDTDEPLVVVPLYEMQRLIDAADIATIDKGIANLRAGLEKGKTSEEVLEFLAYPTALAYWRTKRGFSLERLAWAAGITKRYLAELERGKRKGTPVLFLRLARALSITMEDIVIDESTDEPDETLAE